MGMSEDSGEGRVPFGGMFDGSGGPLRPKEIVPPALILAVLVGVFFQSALRPGQTLLDGDLSLLFYPGYVYFRECVSQGRLPLWDPYVGCGEPFLADLQHGVFYPPNVIYLLVRPAVGITIVTCFHVFLAAFGSYVLCRLLAISRTGSLLAGVLYGFSSYAITKVEFPPELASASWAPLVLAAFIHWLRHRGLRSFLLIAVALCLQFLAGFPEIVAFTVLGLIVLALFAGVSDWRARGELWRPAVPIVVLGGAGVVAVLLSMVQFLPTWEAIRLSIRGEEVQIRLDLTSLHPLAVFSLVMSTLYGAGDTYWAPSCRDYSTGAIYTSVAATAILITAALYAVSARRYATGAQTSLDRVARLRTPYLATVLLLFFLMAMGRYTHLFELLRMLIPVMKGFSSPAKCLFWVLLSFSCLAGVGLDVIGGTAGRRMKEMPGRRGVLLRWGGVLAFVALGLFVGACLLNGGQLGKYVLMQCFNLDSVAPAFIEKIDWSLTVLDSLKMIAVGFVTALLLQVWAFRRRGRSISAAAIIIVAFADLYLTNSDLVEGGPASVLERPSSHHDRLVPPDRVSRFMTFRPDFHLEKRKRMTAELPRPQSVEVLEPDAFSQTLTDSWTQWIRMKREALCILWPVVDKAFGLTVAGTFPPQDAASVIDRITQPGVRPKVKSRLLRMLNCDRVLLTPEPADTHRIAVGPIHVWHYEPAMPRAYVVGGVWALRGKKEVGPALESRVFDPERMALIVRESSDDRSILTLRIGKVTHRVERVQYGPDSLDIDVSSQAPGLLVVSDAYYPGWSATVNGRATKIYQVNGGFRGVVVPAGQSKVKMTYQPRSLVIGAAVSLATFLLVLFLVTHSPRIRNPHMTRPPEAGQANE